MTLVLSFLIDLGVAGFSAALFGLPFDFVKTTLQNMRPDKHGNMPYKSFADCVLKIMRKDIFAFYRALPVFYVRVAPHSVVHLTVFDSMIQFHNRHLNEK